jgi:5-oxoprolinase (ATP-hydrolysing)
MIDTVYAEDRMDDGSLIKLSLTINRVDGSAIFDFTGTDPEMYGNCNAPRSIASSAIIYCLRCLVNSDIPLN